MHSVLPHLGCLCLCMSAYACTISLCFQQHQLLLGRLYLRTSLQPAANTQHNRRQCLSASKLNNHTRCMESCNPALPKGPSVSCSWCCCARCVHDAGCVCMCVRVSCVLRHSQCRPHTPYLPPGRDPAVLQLRRLGPLTVPQQQQPRAPPGVTAAQPAAPATTAACRPVLSAATALSAPTLAAVFKGRGATGRGAGQQQALHYRLDS